MGERMNEEGGGGGFEVGGVLRVGVYGVRKDRIE